jgi:hypothetical protein
VSEMLVPNENPIENQKQKGMNKRQILKNLRYFNKRFKQITQKRKDPSPQIIVFS